MKEQKGDCAHPGEETLAGFLEELLETVLMFEEEIVQEEIQAKPTASPKVKLQGGAQMRVGLFPRGPRIQIVL